ncbi:MAG: zf-HC2 domain-containing protein [Phycisphaerae bacterium]
MLTCRHFRNLFDAHLDGELSESQAAELHAHLLQCPECQREVETLRACGDVIGLDARGPRLSADFTERVMSAVPARRGPVRSGTRSWHQVRRWTELGLAPAAAAALVLAVLIPSGESVVSPTAPAIVSMDPSAVAPKVLGENVEFTDLLGGAEVDGLVKLGQDSVREFDRAAGRVKVLWNDTLADLQSELAQQAEGRPAADAADESDSFVRELMRPFFDLLNPTIPARSAVEDIERF